MKRLLFILLLSFSFTATLLVPEEYSTIQSAIDASSDGDIILVNDGTYPEFIDNELNGDYKEVSIVSINGPENTIIQGDGGEKALVRLGDASISGFTIKDANICCGQAAGGAIFAYNSTIKNCIIEDNEARWGAGIYGNHLTIENCIIRNNAARNFSGNHNGGGIYIAGGSNSISSCSIYGNTCWTPSGLNRGGGIYIGGGNTTITDTEIYSNALLNGGGYGAGIAVNKGTVNLSKTIIRNNTIDGGSGKGGAIAFETVSGTDFILAEIINCTIINNNANLADDIYMEGFAPLTVYAANNIYNTANIYEEGGSVDFTNEYYSVLYDCPLDAEYHLQEGSLCIDAGHPDLDDDGNTWENDIHDQDPDGTRFDIGAYYFHQTLGCTDPEACNYNEEATIDDGSCTGPYLCDDMETLVCDLDDCIILGCTNPDASNYNPDAEEDDGSCCIELWGECYNIETTTELSLSVSGLNGEISSKIGQLVNLERLDLANNQLTGSIPTEIENLTNLEYIRLSFNQLTGPIPSSIGNLTNLGWLDLENNQLVGEMPSEIGQLTNLSGLILRDNQLSGSIPSEIENLIYLTHLYVENNHLDSIPNEIEHLSSLIFLRLGGNQFYGEIPEVFWSLTSLSYLQLSNNQFFGNLSNNVVNLNGLTHLEINNNLITGVPDNIGELESLFCLEIQDNLISSLPNSICNIYSEAGCFNITNNYICPSYPDCLSEEDIGYQDTSECEPILGDINGDFELNVQDIIVIIDLILAPGYPADYYEIADMNQDGVLNIYDIIFIINIILGN